ncbi:hypothetical protein [Mycolicibacter sinensis]|uniref:Phosphoadenosine phosphosulfate reductase n=1 Tax=Mycolicibacter sinensis (strain JDM601) TaxID=875328 RepID=A0A1A2XVE3_MYCSD|nr:hypothetical protein [Mycolicibacter sinensis]OBI29052.1 hypothetical protein A5710_22640 [Mycolicibacter sinensis]
MSHKSTTAATAEPLTLPGVAGNVVAPKVVASYGMGLDSSCLVLRWLEEPESRDFDLSDLVLVTAHTGDEFESTRSVVERHVLPRLREHSVRLVQCARTQRKTTASGGGVVILDDSTAPRRLFSEGDYKLSDEMISQATIPQLGGFRACSIHAKGNALDPVIAQLTQGQPYRHAIGFEANEKSRALKDAGYNSPLRTGWYPLIEWGYTRHDCHEYVLTLTGTAIPKSACGFCPFAVSSEAGRMSIVERYRAEPQVGARAVFVENVARTFNPRQTLIANSSLADVVEAAGLTDVLAGAACTGGQPGVRGLRGTACDAPGEQRTARDRLTFGTGGGPRQSH